MSKLQEQLRIATEALKDLIYLKPSKRSGIADRALEAIVELDKATSCEEQPISKMMRTLRQAQGITLRDLAQRSGTSASTLSRFENGQWNVAPFKIVKAFNELGYEVKIELLEKEYNE